MARGAVTNGATRGFGLHELRDWIRSRPWLMRFYHHVPQGWRERVSQAYVEHLASKARFPPLPMPSPQCRDAKGPADAGHGVGGANLFAYFRGQFGLGEAARLYAGALMDAGYPITLHDIDIDVPHSFEDSAFAAHLGGGAPHSINLIFVNPDYFDTAVNRIGRAKMEGRHVIACWFWELESIPDAWLPALDQVDEIMVASTFIEQAFRRITRKPIIKVPLPLISTPDSGLARADFGLDRDDFIFLTSFDFHSSIERKNPHAVIQAFRAAFPDTSAPVKLLIKTSNGPRHPERFAELLHLAQTDPRIIIRDAIMDRAHLRSLQRCCDAYVSLHRAEGFGLGLAECMELAKPVIATAWSGNLDFMSEENSCLVSCRLVGVAPGEYPHGEGQQWAEADTHEAASYMRRLFTDRQYAKDIGNRAAVDVATTLSSQNAARALIDRLEEISATLSAPTAATRPKDAR